MACITIILEVEVTNIYNPITGSGVSCGARHLFVILCYYLINKHITLLSIDLCMDQAEFLYLFGMFVHDILIFQMLGFNFIL